MGEDTKDKTKDNLKIREPPKFNLQDIPEPPSLSDIEAPPEPSLSEPSFKKEDNEIAQKFKDSPDMPATPPEEAAAPKKKGLFSRLFKKKEPKDIETELGELKKSAELDIEKSLEDIDKPVKEDKSDLKKEDLDLDIPDAPVDLDEEKPEVNVPEEKDKLKEEGITGSDFHFKEMPEPEPIAEEGKEDATEQETPEIPETPVHEVKGVGEKTAKKLKKAKIKTADHLAELDHEHVAEKAKIPKAHAKKIVAHAKKVVKKKKSAAMKTPVTSKPAPSKYHKEASIKELITDLEEEKKELDSLSKVVHSNDVVSVKGHDDIITLLKQLEDKKGILLDYEKKLKNKEEKLESHKETYLRDVEYVENLKRRLDHDIRERTQYLVDLEKDFFKKGEDIARRQSELEIKEKDFEAKRVILEKKETTLKKLSTDIETREDSLKNKDREIKKLMLELKKQEGILDAKADTLQKRETEYEKKLNTLESHEKQANHILDKKKAELDEKHTELMKLEKRMLEREKRIDIEKRALEYAESQIDVHKRKLEDAEFKEYVRERVHGGEPTISQSDIEETHNIQVPDLQDHTESVHELITKCRMLIDKERATEAKIFYNKLRDTFYKTDFESGNERDKIKNQIRQLYDDINLSAMNK